MSAPVVPPRLPVAAPISERQAAYAEYRRAWRAGVERWLAADRPAHLAVWLP